MRQGGERPRPIGADEATPKPAAANAVRIQITIALIAFVLIRLAHDACEGVQTLTSFGRLLRATVFYRKPAERLGIPEPPRAGPVQSKAQRVLLRA